MKTLIVTAATGQGHLTAAAALAEGFQAAGAGPVVLDACAHPAIKAAAASYNFFLRRSPRWRNGYYAGVHLARLPIVEDRGASVVVPEHACDGNPKSLTEILMEMQR